MATSGQAPPPFAALEVASSGKVIGSLHRQHRAAEFEKVLAKVDKRVPADLDVHLILDNYATHKTPAIKKWLLAHPRFHPHFTPNGAPWLNLVERWFGELTAKMLRRGVHRSVQALERDIRAKLADWNEHPGPFVWTKTTDKPRQSRRLLPENLRLTSLGRIYRIRPAVGTAHTGRAELGRWGVHRASGEFVIPGPTSPPARSRCPPGSQPSTGSQLLSGGPARGRPARWCGRERRLAPRAVDLEVSPALESILNL
jgi:transposase